MKRIVLALLIFLALVSIVIWLMTQRGKLPEDYANFFPRAVGCTWLYRIKTTEQQPLFYETFYWFHPVDNRPKLLIIGGNLKNEVPPGEKQERFLELKIADEYETDQQLSPPAEAVKLAVLQDNAGFFAYCQDVIWLWTKNEQFLVQEMSTYLLQDFQKKLQAKTLVGIDGLAFGHTAHCIFFRPEDFACYLQPETAEKLRFIDYTWWSRKLHFRRMIDNPDAEPPAYFTEERWYERGKGLTQLVQKVGRDGKISLIWELVKFTPGPQRATRIPGS